MKNKSRLIISLLDMRQKSVESDLAEAVKAKAWSKIAGLDGIAIGLLMARRIIEKELLNK